MDLKRDQWTREYLPKYMPLTKEKILDSLYSRCQDRSSRTEDIINGMSKDLEIVFSDDNKKKLLDVIRPYKQSGKHLEKTVNEVYDVLNNLGLDLNLKNMFDFGTNMSNQSPAHQHTIQQSHNHNHVQNSHHIPNYNGVGILNPAALGPTKTKWFTDRNGSSFIIEDHLNASSSNRPAYQGNTMQIIQGQEQWINYYKDQDPSAQFILQKDDSVICFSQVFGLVVIPK